MINKKRLVKLAQRLIRIDSQNPGSDEKALASFIKNYLLRFGLESRIWEFKRGRSNLLAVLKSRQARGGLLITPHLDTVPAGEGWGFAPFAARIQGNKIYGLGATDCKGNLAVAIEVINSLLEEKAALGYNLIFAATADEESGSAWGLVPLLRKKILNPGAAVVLDADDFNIIVTQKGLIHLRVKIEGKKAHGAYPWRGQNAVEMAAEAICGIKKLKFSFRKNPYLRPPTVNVGTIKGGDKVNVVADRCEFELDIRFLPEMSEGIILRQLKNSLRRHAGRFKIEVEDIQSPYAIGRGHPLVAGLMRSAKSQGIKPVIKGSEGATVITFFQQRKIPAVATGFGSGGCAHSGNEFVKIDNLYKGALILENFLRNYRPN